MNNSWLPDWLRDPDAWEIKIENHQLCHYKTPRSAGRWNGAKDMKPCSEHQKWYVLKDGHHYWAEHNRVSLLPIDTPDAYWPPSTLCEKHYLEYTTSPVPVYPELEALHELQEVVFKHGQ